MSLKSRSLGTDDRSEDLGTEEILLQRVSVTMAKILVVEDNADLLALVVRQLQRVGHRVQEASSPTDALELVRTKGAPDVAVLDVTMPVLTGLELLVALREITGRPDLPAVFLSGRVEAADIAAGRALGAAYLTKPYVASALHNAINSLLAAAPVAVPDAW